MKRNKEIDFHFLFYRVLIFNLSNIIFSSIIIIKRERYLLSLKCVNVIIKIFNDEIKND